MVKNHCLSILIFLSLVTQCTSWTSQPIQNESNSMNRRELLVKATRSTFTLSSMVPFVNKPYSVLAYTPDSDPARESLYFISRVQEATVQQERFVRRATDQQALKNKMKLTLLLVEKNYRLLDQITYCSRLVPADHLVEATEAGNIAAEELQGAIDYVRSELKNGPMTEAQKDYITEALSTTREQLFIFLDFMPQDKLEAARARIEDENKMNVEEFDGDEDAGVYNMPALPWKNRQK